MTDHEAGVDPTAHEWVSFDHDGESWLFDVSFLMSNWRCIWNDGCLGIRSTPDIGRGEGCCSFGAHFSDDEDLQRVKGAASELDANDWQHIEFSGPLFVKDDSGDWQTALVDDACVFLNRPGFAGGHGCALHRGADTRGESFLDWKPEVCWQVPLRLEFHADENGRTVNTLRQWERHDWGPGGSEFGWWCTDDERAFVGHEAVYVTLRVEIITLIGEPLANRLFAHLRSRYAEQLLPHPVNRSRK